MNLNHVEELEAKRGSSYLQIRIAVRYGHEEMTGSKGERTDDGFWL